MHMETSKSALEQLLKREILEINFNKKDGTPRTMICSLKHEFLPKKEISSDEPLKTKKENPNVVSVWDLEKDNFRSFRLDSVNTFQIISEGYEF